MSIVTVTLNPCIDRTITIEKPIQIGGTHHVVNTREEISGKGLNVSYLLHNWGIDTKCIGYDFRDSGLPVAKELQKRGIKALLHSVSGKLRCNIKVFETSEKTMSEFNEKGAMVSSANISAMQFLVDRQLQEMNPKDILVITGSVPQGVPKDIYRQYILKAKKAGVFTVLDSSGELLKEGIKAVPHILKPNKEELETILGHSISTEREIVEACKNLLETGIQYICVTLGAQGAILASKEGIYKANALQIEVKGIQGAGDSMVAGMCVAVMEEKGPIEMLRCGMAAAGGSLLLEGTQMCEKEDFDRLVSEVKIEKID